MIPKVIHYCWFGGNPLPEQAIECIESWKKHCPDYEIREWNEENFNIEASSFAEQAYAAKKLAFVADYFRAWVLYNEGGIYLDSDVLMEKNFDCFLSDKFFTGFESFEAIAADTMGCEKGHPLAKAILDTFESDTFVLEGERHNETMPIRVARAIRKHYGIKRFFNRKIVLKDAVIYPSVYFSPIDFSTKKRKASKETHSVHLFAGSWLESDNSKRLLLKKHIYKFYKYIKRLKILIFGN